MNKFVVYVFILAVMVVTTAGLYFYNPTQEAVLADMYESCVRKKDYQRATCLLPYFKSITMNAGAGEAMARAKEIKDSGVINDCHLPAHEIGRTNFKKFKGDLSMAFGECAVDCLAGCFHGVMEEYVDNSGDVNELMANISQTCSLASENGKIQLHCVHGVGHGLIRHDVEKIVETTKLCKGLKEPSHMVACRSGLFMENANIYLTLPEAELKIALGEVCRLTQESGHDGDLKACMNWLGRILVVYAGEDKVKARELCNYTPSDLRPECLRGVEIHDALSTFEDIKI